MINKSLLSPSTYLASHELCEIPTETHGKPNKFFLSDKFKVTFADKSVIFLDMPTHWAKLWQNAKAA